MKFYCNFTVTVLLTTYELLTIITKIGFLEITKVLLSFLITHKITYKVFTIIFCIGAILQD